ncbi:MAG: Type secretion system domain protein [Betaproteobacteria bacterium]|nr:Type secretion system domain protein [Betaproteobacteria bacterium]
MRFDVKAITAQQGVTAFALEAADDAAARREVKARGFVLLNVAPARSPLWHRERFPLLLFSQELTALLDAGLGLLEALQALAERHQQGAARDTLRQVLDHLQEGHALSVALERCPQAFPPLYVATVRASERTGDLSRALARFVAYQAQMEALRAKLVTSSIYPLLLLFVGGAVTLFLLAFVVPKFAAIYADLGREQPLTSRLLMEFGSLLNAHGTMLALAALAALAVGVHALFNPQLRERLLRRLANVPGIGERLRIVQLTRLYRTAGMLLRGGIPAVQALGMVGELLPAALRGELAGALREIREGKPLSGALESHALTTPVAIRMLRVGERTGDMGTMMERIAAFHDDEVTHWVDRSTRLFEPLLMVVIGLVIGVIVMALYMPIFELAGSLQ